MKKHDTPQAKITLAGSGLASDLLAAAEAQVVPLPPLMPAGEAVYRFADDLAATQAADAPRRATRMETWLSFRLQDETFGLPITHVLEVVRVGAISRVPEAPAAIRGVTNLRGRVVPVVDLRVRLWMAAATLGERSRLLVATARGRLIALLVDDAWQVVRIDRNEVQPPPADVLSAGTDYLIGMISTGDALMFLLDVERVLLVQPQP